MVAGGPGSRWRARILRTTSAEWTPWAIASAQAASTAGSPSVSTAVRMSTICRLPSSAPASLRRTRSIDAGSEPLPDGLEQAAIEDRRMLPRADLAPELDFADVEPVAQEIGERASGEGDAADGPPIREMASSGDDPALPKVGQQ